MKHIAWKTGSGARRRPGPGWSPGPIRPCCPTRPTPDRLGSPANNWTDIFLYDRITDTTALVSHAAGFPTVACGSGAGGADFAGGGRFVVLEAHDSRFPWKQPLPSPCNVTSRPGNVPRSARQLLYGKVRLPCRSVTFPWWGNLTGWQGKVVRGRSHLIHGRVTLSSGRVRLCDANANFSTAG